MDYRDDASNLGLDSVTINLVAFIPTFVFFIGYAELYLAVVMPFLHSF